MVSVIYRSRWISVLLILGSAVLVSCVSTHIPSLSSGQISVEQEEDEKEIWEASERLEHYLERKEVIYKDTQLTLYLANVMAKLLSQPLKSPRLQPRIKIFESPAVNALSLPNGALYITTGLLARIENEAQLATVLGHELTHYVNCHALREQRNQQNQQTVAALVGLILAAPTGGLGLEATKLWAMSSVSGYSQELETEADRSALQLMVAAGYDPREASRVFEHLLAVVKEQGSEESHYFASHPKLQDRIDSTRGLIREFYADAVSRGHLYIGANEYLEKIENLLLDNAALDIDSGRFNSAQAAINKHLVINPRSARAYFLLGELCRKKSVGNQEIENALADYLKAVQLPDTPVEVYREMGLLYRSRGKQEKANVAFQRYLSMKPDAVDASIIRSYMTETKSS